MFGTRILETTLTAGTGDVTLVGAKTGFQTFKAALSIASPKFVHYLIKPATGWEIGWGVLTPGGADTLSRSVIASSNSNAPLNLDGTEALVVNDIPSELMLTAYRAITANESQAITDFGKVVNHTDTNDHTVTLIDGATISIGFRCTYRHSGASGKLTLDGYSTDQVENANSIDLYPGQSVTLEWFGAAGWLVVATLGYQPLIQNWVNRVISNLGLTSPAITTPTITTPTVTGLASFERATYSGSQELAKGADVASSSTTNIWGLDGNFIHITGTTTITSFGTAPRAGASRLLVFDAALTLTHSSNLICPGATNMAIRAGDVVRVIADTTSMMRVVGYLPGDGVLYEDSGSATPYFFGTTTPGTNTYGTQIMYWLRKRDLVVMDVNISMTAFDPTTAGTVRAGGSPFTANASKQSFPPYATFENNYNIPAGYNKLHARMLGGENVFRLQNSGDNIALVNAAPADFNNTTQVSWGGCIRI